MIINLLLSSCSFDGFFGAIYNPSFQWKSIVYVELLYSNSKGYFTFAY